MSRMFVCGGTGAGLKYLDSVEVLDGQSGESEVYVTLEHLVPGYCADNILLEKRLSAAFL